MRTFRAFGSLTLLAVFAGVTAIAQHEPTAADIQNGQQLFLATCVNCHGQDGDTITGVALKSGRFRRAASDADLTRIIINGIPSTGMPPNPMTEEQASTIVAYLRASVTGASSAAASSSSSSSSSPANIVRGRSIVEGKGNCLSCHQINGVGSRLGPDLTDVGTRALRGQAAGGVDIEGSLLDPNAVVAPGNRFVRIVTSDNKTITGRLMNHDRFTAQILDSNERLISVSKADLREFTILPTSTMPSYSATLTTEERADVVSYLASLKSRSLP